MSFIHCSLTSRKRDVYKEQIVLILHLRRIIWIGRHRQNWQSVILEVLDGDTFNNCLVVVVHAKVKRLDPFVESAHGYL